MELTAAPQALPQAAEPAVVAAEPHFVVLYKPANMHTVPLAPGGAPTLLDWCAARFPNVLTPRGKQPREGGAVHRLDYETAGLTLMARSQRALDAFNAQQAAGRFVKEYRARTRAQPLPPPAGFPPLPAEYARAASLLREGGGAAFAVSSAFRAYGPGRKAARPLAAPAGVRVYRTELAASARAGPEGLCWTVRLARGFRHQIRCHLAWLGYPLLNDALYGGAPDGGQFGLEAPRLEFTHPVSGAAVRYEYAAAPPAFSAGTPAAAAGKA